MNQKLQRVCRALVSVRFEWNVLIALGFRSSVVVPLRLHCKLGRFNKATFSFVDVVTKQTSFHSFFFLVSEVGDDVTGSSVKGKTRVDV